VNGLQQTLTLAWRSLVQVRRNPWELGDYSIQPILFLLLFLYVFVSSAFVPVETMPEWLQGFVYANPVSLLADAARALMNGGPAAAPALGSLVWALGIALVFAPLSVYALNRRLARG
jgi:oleandomycin transport system permease protein